MKSTRPAFIYCALAASLLSACGKDTSGTKVPNSDSSAVIANPGQTDKVQPQVLAFNPPSGTYVTLPSTVTVSFSEEVSGDEAASTANWSILCPSGERFPTSATLSASKLVVTLTLPSLADVAEGGLCTLTASQAITDLAGNALASAGRVASYRRAAGGGGSQDTTPPQGKLESPFAADRIYGDVLATASAYDVGYNQTGVRVVEFYIDASRVAATAIAPYRAILPTQMFSNGRHVLSLAVTDNAGNRATYVDSRIIDIENHAYSETPKVGGSGGNAFTESAPAGYNMRGLSIRAGAPVFGSLVYSVQPIWWTAWGETYEYIGGAHGSNDGTRQNMFCPVEMRVSGIYGRAGSKIDRLGIICRRLDGTASPIYLGPYGGFGGDLFERECPTGTFVTRLLGRTGGAVDQLKLGCE